MRTQPTFRFDPARFFEARTGGHGAVVGIGYQAHGDDWAELTLPYDERLIGDVATGVIASGPILTLMDMATSVAIWLKRGQFVPQATLDLRIDYLRPATPGRTVIGRGECYRLTRSIAFVRGQAHDGDPDDPLAHVAGTFMFTEVGMSTGVGMATGVAK
ncbi:PaaI family thioesterase [Sphingomonas qomolangmaensis]|uniref:PaaI family thioesterase n=1 Tax=Sphingomonas qomolangmaensis TaxID=2918765 RepID=A0ABY5LBN5_9SPHN|nr:PaaI family thioesterase [Sphingomonas qomolangmaensis]UUL82096.1 PaaI family thioesterase [Sphingomonas qomolangmaensis]